MKKLFTRVGLVLGSVFAVGAASAQESAVDITSVVSGFQADATAAIAAIGIAMVTLAGIAVTYKWIKGTFFS